MYISLILILDTANMYVSEKNKPSSLKDKIKERDLKVSLVKTKFHLDLSKKDWYVFDDCFGTSGQKKNH